MTAVPSTHPWLPASPCDPTCIPVRPADAAPVERLRHAARVTARMTAVATVLALGMLAAVAVPVLPAPATARIQRRWALGLVAATGLRLRRSGPPAPPAPAGGVLVVANHVSWLDVLALHAVAPVRMLAKREVRTWPLIGAMAARVGTVFLDRERLHQLPGAVAGLADALADGTAVGVFAEGTTRCGRELGPFRPAAFQAAIDAGVPVQPVALAYRCGAGATDHSAAFVGDDTLWASLRRVISAPDLDLEVTVLPALDPASAAAGPGRAGPRRALADACAAAVAAALPTTEPTGPVAEPTPRVGTGAAVTDLRHPAPADRTLDRVA